MHVRQSLLARSTLKVGAAPARAAAWCCRSFGAEAASRRTYSKSFDGRYAIAHSAVPADATAGGLYVFVNRRGARMKVLYFDRSGRCVWVKRLEEGQSTWAR